MKFPYGQYEVDPTPARPALTIVHRPVMPFRLIGPEDNIVFYGLADTGADETLLPQSMASLVGLSADPSQTALMQSASGADVAATYGTVTFEIGRGRERFRWRAKVGVVDQPWQEAILGQAGFLRFFDVTFFGGKRELELKRNRVAFD